MNTEAPFDPSHDRRQPSDTLVLMVKQVHEHQMALDAKIDTHMRELKQGYTEAVAQVLKDAFPDGDPDGHRRYHEASIKKAEEQAEFWTKMKVELAKYGLVLFLGWILYAAGQALLTWIQTASMRPHP